jgi:hypothetical protein
MKFITCWGFDTAYKSLNAMLDWPPHSLDLFIRVVQQNAGKLSASKRKSHFSWLRDNELEQAEVLVQQAFAREEHWKGLMEWFQQENMMSNFIHNGYKP